MDAYDFDPETVSPYDDMPKNTKFDWGVNSNDLISTKRAKSTKDAYDFDSETVSPYDDMPKNTKFDWGASRQPNDMISYNDPARLAQKVKKDAYDFDPETVSPYDDMPKNTKFDWGASRPIKPVSMDDLS